MASVASVFYLPNYKSDTCMDARMRYWYRLKRALNEWALQCLCSLPGYILHKEHWGLTFQEKRMPPSLSMFRIQASTSPEYSADTALLALLCSHAGVWAEIIVFPLYITLIKLTNVCERERRRERDLLGKHLQRALILMLKRHNISCSTLLIYVVHWAGRLWLCNFYCI